MNIKHILLLPSVFALTLAAVPFMPAFAQTQTAPNQAAPFKRGMDRLNLTDDQKAEMQKIRQETKSKIAASLKQEGITISQGQNLREVMRNLDDEDKKARIKSQIKVIHQEAEQKIQAIPGLTTEQKAMMQQRRGKMKDRMQQRRQGQPGQFQPNQTPVQSGI